MTRIYEKNAPGRVYTSHSFNHPGKSTSNSDTNYNDYIFNHNLGYTPDYAQLYRTSSAQMTRIFHRVNSTSWYDGWHILSANTTSITIRIHRIEDTSTSGYLMCAHLQGGSP